MLQKVTNVQFYESREWGKSEKIFSRTEKSKNYLSLNYNMLITAAFVASVQNSRTVTIKEGVFITERQ